MYLLFCSFQSTYHLTQDKSGQTCSPTPYIVTYVARPLDAGAFEYWRRVLNSILARIFFHLTFFVYEKIGCVRTKHSGLPLCLIIVNSVQIEQCLPNPFVARNSFFPTQALFNVFMHTNIARTCYLKFKVRPPKSVHEQLSPTNFKPLIKATVSFQNGLFKFGLGLELFRQVRSTLQIKSKQKHHFRCHDSTPPGLA